MTDPRSDQRLHARFLSYRERHVYFGRGVNRQPLSLEAFAALEGERDELLRVGKGERTAEQHERLAELATMLHLD